MGLLSNTSTNYYKLSNELQAYGDNSVFGFLMRKKYKQVAKKSQEESERQICFRHS